MAVTPFAYKSSSDRIRYLYGLYVVILQFSNHSFQESVHYFVNHKCMLIYANFNMLMMSCVGFPVTSSTFLLLKC